MQFLRLDPKFARLRLQLRHGPHSHAKKMFRLARFLSTGADAFQKLFLRYRIVRFDVIRSDTRPRSNKLADDSASHRPLRNYLCEINDCFAEARRPLLQIVNAFSAGFFANNQYLPVVPKRIVINAGSVTFGLRHFFVIRHSCFVIDSSFVIFPGPHKARPGFAPVCWPSLITCTPFTKTCFTPTAYWCGFS